MQSSNSDSEDGTNFFVFLIYFQLTSSPESIESASSLAKHFPASQGGESKDLEDGNDSTDSQAGIFEASAVEEESLCRRGFG